MNYGIREFLNVLEKNNELLRINKQVDLRYVSAIIAKSEKAVLFENISGYKMMLVGGLLNSRKRLALGIGVNLADIGNRFIQGLNNPISPVVVKTSPVKEVIMKGDEVDLIKLPIPVISKMDGSAYISSAVTVAKDPEYGMNAGMYRLMFKNKNTLGIAANTPNNLQLFYLRALKEKRPLEVSISIGVHPVEMLCATYKAAAGINELAIAGGLRGNPVEMVKCETISVEAIANAEIVLEGEILPEGYIFDEGRFGEFTRLMGHVRINPIIRVKAITRRSDALFYSLHMPWENIFLGAPAYEAAALRVLRDAGVETKAVNITPGGCCHWHVIASIKKRPGDGKNALAALLSIADIKHAVVTDDDINIFDPEEVEWAIATRVQADEDVIIFGGARAKPADPSLHREDYIQKTTAKMGIDATISEDVPLEIFDRISYPFSDEIKLEDFTDEKKIKEKKIYPEASSKQIKELSGKIKKFLKKDYYYFSEILEHFRSEDYRKVLRAMGSLNENEELQRDKEGRYSTK